MSHAKLRSVILTLKGRKNSAETGSRWGPIVNSSGLHLGAFAGEGQPCNWKAWAPCHKWTSPFRWSILNLKRWKCKTSKIAQRIYCSQNGTFSCSNQLIYGADLAKVLTFGDWQEPEKLTVIIGVAGLTKAVSCRSKLMLKAWNS